MPAFTGEQPRKFQPLPEGDYALVISKIDEAVVSKRSKNAGAPMWRVTYDVEGTNRKVWDNLIFVPSTDWKISNWWRALGRALSAEQRVETGDPEDYLGLSLKAHLAIREFNGEAANEIAYFIEPLAAAPKTQASADPTEIPF